MTWINEHIDNYYKWLKDKTVILADGKSGWILINTPFVGLFNDHIELYAKKNNNIITLSDNGETAHNLELVGVNINRKRKDIVDAILLNYGIKANGNEFFVECNASNFPQKKHNLLTAVLELNDLYMLSEPNVSHAFKEDVRQYLDELDISYTADFISRGTSGMEFTFDFQISKKSEEIVIKSFNSFSKQNLPAFLFTWQDIKPVREKSSKKSIKAIAFANDNNKEIKLEYLDALRTNNADCIIWSDRYSEINKQKIR